MISLNENNFKSEVLESDLPVVVDFWASWCGPCKIIAPVIEDLAREFEKKVKFAKLNVEDGPRIATKYGIMSVPTILFFKKGKAIDQVVGALSKAELKIKVEESLIWIP